MNATDSRRVRDMFYGCLLFAAIGPLIGTLAFSLLVATLSAAGGDARVMLPPILFSYLLGIVPAALTGIAAGLLRPHTATLLQCMGVGLVGSGITVGLGMLFIDPAEAVSAGALMWLTVPSFSAGTLSAMMLRAQHAGRASSSAASGEADC